MSDHSHYQTLKGSLVLLPGLLLILLLETVAGFLGNELAINAHSFDVLSDTLAFLIVIVGSGFSGLLDDHGRAHRGTHLEQRWIAVINLLVLWIGVGLVLGRSILSFGERSDPAGLENWWVIAGPALAVVVYWWIGKRLQKLSAKDLTTNSLGVHVKGDVFVALLAVGLTLLSLLFYKPWLNPIGGIIMSVVLFYISLELLGYIVKREGKLE